MSQVLVKEQSSALVGMKYALLKAENVLSFAAEGGKINFGRLVSRGSSQEQAILPAVSADVTDLVKRLGVTLQSHARENQKDGLEPSYTETESMSIMTKGAVWVESEQVVSVADPVFVRFQGGNEGAFRIDADTADAVALPNARWLTDSVLEDGKNMAVLELGAL